MSVKIERTVTEEMCDPDIAESEIGGLDNHEPDNDGPNMDGSY